MKNKFLKSIASVVAVVMLLSMVPAVVSAEVDAVPSILLTDVVLADGEVTVTAEVSNLTEVTLLAVRGEKDYEGLTDANFPSDVAASSDEMSPLEKQVEYIDQPTLNAENYDEAEGVFTYTFPLRDRESDSNLAMSNVDRYINVFLGGRNVSAVDKSVVEKIAAPVVEFAEGDYIADVTENYVTVTDEKGWLDEASLLIYTTVDGEEVSVGEVKKTGFVFNSGYPTNEKATYTIKGTVPNEDIYEKFEEVSFSAISKLGAIYEEVPAPTVANKETNDKTAWTFVVPTSFVPSIDSAVSVTWTVKDGEADAVAAEAEMIIDRPAADADDQTELEKEVVFVATIAEGENSLTKEFKFTLMEVGVDGYTITKNDITVSANAAAFGEEGSKVVTVKISKDNIEPTEQVVTINNIKMFYTPERSTGANHVFVAIVRENNDNAEAVATVADIIGEAATSIYYGKPSNPTSDAALTAADVARGLNMFKTGAYDGVTFSDEQYLTADVVGVAKIEAPAVARLLAAFKSEGSADKSGFDILAE